MEHAVIAYLPLCGDDWGSKDEREVVFALQELMAAAIEVAGAGEFDGDEWGKGECVLYMYGPDADRLFAIVEPLLKSCPLASRGFAIKRYGEASDPNAQEIRVTWTTQNRNDGI